MPSQDNTREATTRRSTAENTSGEYLHIRFSKLAHNAVRRHAQTPTVAKMEQQNKEKVATEGGFSRTKNIRVVSLGRTTAASNRPPLTAPSEQMRPSTSHSHSEKTAYFDEFLSSRDVLKELKVMSHIGKGAFSVVSNAVGRDGKQSYAVKAYEKLDALDWNRLACIKREIRHLKALDSSRVVKLHHLAREHKKLYLVMENAGKQSLGGVLRKEKRLSEGSARRFFREILEGVGYCHG
jgi:hypothetical protein